MAPHRVRRERAARARGVPRRERRRVLQHLLARHPREGVEVRVGARQPRDELPERPPQVGQGARPATLRAPRRQVPLRHRRHAGPGCGGRGRTRPALARLRGDLTAVVEHHPQQVEGTAEVAGVVAIALPRAEVARDVRALAERAHRVGEPIEVGLAERLDADGRRVEVEATDHAADRAARRLVAVPERDGLRHERLPRSSLVVAGRAGTENPASLCHCGSCRCCVVRSVVCRCLRSGSRRVLRERSCHSWSARSRSASRSPRDHPRPAHADQRLGGSSYPSQGLSTVPRSPNA